MKSLNINIDFISNDNDLTALEKIKKLDSLLEMYKNTIEDIKKDILKDYLYCAKCDDYYKKTSWEVTNLENGNVQYECPKGHKTIDNYWC